MKDKLIIYILLLVCIPMVSTDIYVPVIPTISEELLTTNSIVLLTITTYMMGFAISMLLAGFLIDIYGNKKIVNIFLTLYIICCVCLYLNTNIYTFISIRFLQGIFGGCGTVIGRIMVKELYPSNKEQISKMTTLTLAMAIAPAIAPQIGAIITKYISWNWCFMATAFMSLIILYGINKHYQEDGKNLKQMERINFNFFRIPIKIISVFDNKKFIGATLLITFTWTSYFCFIGLSSIYFQKIFNFSEIEYSHVIALITIGYIAGTLITKYLNHISVSSYLMIFMGVVIFTVSSVFLIYSFISQHLYLLIISAMILRFSIGFIMPTSQVIATNSVSKGNFVGWAMGCLLSMEFLISGLFIFIGGVLDHYLVGMGATITSFISVIFVILGFILLIKK